MNVDRILANLRKEQEEITEAIAALEEFRAMSRPARNASGKIGRRKRKAPWEASRRRGDIKKKTDASRDGAKIIPFVPPATRVG